MHCTNRQLCIAAQSHLLREMCRHSYLRQCTYRRRAVRCTYSSPALHICQTKTYFFGDYQSPNSEQTMYDVVVVGAGHAGTEAACAAARAGARTLLLTQKLPFFGERCDNPSFGGIGKGHLVREVDALDGVMGRICDKSGVFYKMISMRVGEGPDVWAPRAVINRELYTQHVEDELRNTENLTIRDETATDLLIDQEQCTGVKIGGSESVQSSSIVITTGNFLDRYIQIGRDLISSKQIGDISTGLAKTLQKCGFKLRRLKTGSPPKLIKQSIDSGFMYNKMLPDAYPVPFSFLNERVAINPANQKKCLISITNPAVGDILTKSMYMGVHMNDSGHTVRDPSSIEMKYLRQPDGMFHIVLEPDDEELMNAQGLITTMPADMQQNIVNCCHGLEHARIAQPGYGEELDFVDPRQLHASLETKLLPGLFLAGYINGTVGYEESAAQGLMAGLNAARKSKQLSPITISRREGCIGALVDDLTSHGVYMPAFANNEEYRMTLREDNADKRLTELGFSAGCVSRTRYTKMLDRWAEITEAISTLKSTSKTVKEWQDLVGIRGAPKQILEYDQSAYSFLSEPGADVERLAAACPELQCLHRVGHQLKTESTHEYAAYKEEHDRKMALLPAPPRPPPKMRPKMNDHLGWVPKKYIQRQLTFQQQKYEAKEAIEKAIRHEYGIPDPKPEKTPFSPPDAKDFDFKRQYTEQQLRDFDLGIGAPPKQDIPDWQDMGIEKAAELVQKTLGDDLPLEYREEKEEGSDYKVKPQKWYMTEPN